MTRRHGFTLIEVLIALVILGVVAVSLARFTGEFYRSVGQSAARTVATAAAQEQIEMIRADPNYTGLVATYNAVTTTGFPGFPSMTRVTRATRTTGTSPRRDYTTVTVTVSDRSIGLPVNLTIVVAAP